MQARIKRWVRKYLGDSPLTFSIGLTVLCLPAIVSVMWVATGYWENVRIESAIQRQTLQIASRLTDSEERLEMTFGRLRNTTNWVAEEGHTLSAILNSADVADENAFLQQVASSFGLDLIYVMNDQGISVAASNWDTPSSTIGINYSDREHFQMAMTGVPGRQFAVGRTTKVLGFFFSMPVRHNDKVVGTVGVKVDQPRIQHLANIDGNLIHDDYGIVVMADNPKYMFNAVPDATVSKLPEALLMQRYARKSFDRLPLVSAGIERYPDIMLLDGKPVLVGSRTMIDAGVTVNVVSDFYTLRDTQQQRYLLFWGLVLGASMLFWGLWLALLSFMRARLYRQELEVANQQLSELNKELHDQASLDFLTGALNRRAFSESLTTELERVRRYGTALSVGAIDIDHFKGINDTRGHAVGDVALKHLVDSIAQHMRRTDVLARIGGEEFVLMMPNTKMADALLVLDRIRQIIGQSRVPGVEPPLQFTFSAGIAQWKPEMSDKALLSAADEALYAAKGAGRNQVLAYG